MKLVAVHWIRFKLKLDLVAAVYAFECPSSTGDKSAMEEHFPSVLTPDKPEKAGPINRYYYTTYSLYVGFLVWSVLFGLQSFQYVYIAGAKFAFDSRIRTNLAAHFITFVQFTISFKDDVLCMKEGLAVSCLNKSETTIAYQPRDLPSTKYEAIKHQTTAPSSRLIVQGAMCSSLSCDGKKASHITIVTNQQSPSSLSQITRFYEFKYGNYLNFVIPTEVEESLVLGY